MRKLTTYLTGVLLVTIVYCTIISCKNKEAYPVLKNHFTIKEIKDLNKINDFFISEFLKSTKENYKEALTMFMDSLKFNGQFSSNDDLLFKKQLNLYSSISESTFNKIWELNTTKSQPYLNEAYISAKTFGKYYSFLNEVGTKNKFAKLCYEKIEASGDYNPLFLDSYFYNNHNTFNYNDFYNQLIIAIYYLSAIDDYERAISIKKGLEEQLIKVKPQLN
ncbi:hypothetical protein [uncultured Winogradskyella sp.]|uniref:hypothetical protein n=1 Tax=uncultured Winogradskyella sp. TaxID=395353 RepID=UPI0030D7EFE3|tara:strand:- start:109279 stop:109938 length:660 start_codon:yes stop_codon:yes gene_type:complete